jgi:RND family efflux transporter MFP subunit
MRRVGTMVFVLTIVIAACGGSAPQPAADTPPPIRAKVDRAAAVEVDRTVELSGTVEALRTAAVASRVMATVVAVLVQPGDSVKAGQVLAEIDPAAAKGQEAQARGALAQAEAAMALAQRNYERFVALHASSAASELELDLARMQFEQAKGAVEQAQGAVAAAASIAADAQVVAPFAGRVAAKLVEVGDLAVPGRPLFLVESAAGRRLVVQVPESLASGVRVGSQIPVRLDAAPAGGNEFGRVVEMTPGANPASHTFTVKIQLDGVDIPSGAAGRAAIPAGRRSTVTVPERAVLLQGGVAMVVLRDQEGKARTRAVTVGNRLPDGRVEVLSGLSGGEVVLVDVRSLPADGTPVEELQ